MAICVVDRLGAFVREGTTSADAPSIARYLEPFLEARQVKAALSAMPVKSDRNDARGIAQVVRTGWFKPVHVKSIGSERARTLAAARKHVIRSVAAAEQVIRGLLRPFGLKIGIVSRKLFAARVRELVAGEAMLEAIMDPLLASREALMRECARLHRLVLKTVRNDPACRLLMTMSGIGPVFALAFRSSVDDPSRFLQLPIRGRLSRTNTPAIPVRRDRPSGPDHEDW